MQGQRITVFGGSGFVGRYVVKRLAAAGALVRVPVRHVEGAKFLKLMGNVGQVSPVWMNFSNEASVRAAVVGSDAVINAVGILSEGYGQNFGLAHVDGPAVIAEAAAQNGVQQFVHLSAIGADAESKSQYAMSKAMGEAATRAAFPATTILRPSVVFGQEDDFFNRFAGMARTAPVLPLVDGGKTKFQPVYVGDVADAIIAALHTDTAAGLTYELGGPDVMTFREIIEYIMEETGRRRPLVSAPSRFLRPLAGLLEKLPASPLTRDQLILLQSDNVVTDGAAGLTDLGVSPTAINAIAPAYLMRYRDGGQFARKTAI